MYSKKGVSGHIEVIISFLIFLAFVSFLLFFVNPIEENKETTHYLEATEQAIIEYVEANVTSFSVTILNDALLQQLGGVAGGRECFCFPYDTNSFPAAYRLAPINEGGSRAKSKIFPAASKICIRPTMDAALKRDKFYRLRFSDEIVEDDAICTGLQDPLGKDMNLAANEYRLGVRNEYMLVSDNNITILQAAYGPPGGGVSYDNLKTSLGLQDVDFNLVINKMDGTNIVNLKAKEPPKANIMAKNIPIEIIDNTGGITPAIMNIQVWT